MLWIYLRDGQWTVNNMTQREKKVNRNRKRY